MLPALFCLLSSLASAAPPVIEYRIYVEPQDRPRQGCLAVGFAAFADSTGGAALWTESHCATPTPAGQVEVSLGSVSPLTQAVLARDVFWLQIRLGNRVLPTRRKVERVAMQFGTTAADSSIWAPLPPARLPDGRTRLAVVDFGPSDQVAPHRIGVGTDERTASLGWYGGPVRERSREMQNSGPFYCDFMEGMDASFAIAVDYSSPGGPRRGSGPKDGSYRVILTIGDSDADRGPFDILDGDRVIAQGLRTGAGDIGQFEFDLKPTANGRLQFRLKSQGCGSWAVIGLDLYGPPGSRLTELSPQVRAKDPIPRPERLRSPSTIVLRDVLGSYCRFLMAERLSDGNFSFHGAWYENAYPVRTLLAGGILLNEPGWSAAAFDCLDRFVAAQRPNGGWYTSYFGQPRCSPAGAADTLSSNLADIGTMSLCLALAAPFADEPRRDRYLTAATRFADQVVLPAQMPGGAFPNGLYHGHVHVHPYAVATATQAASLAVLGAVTGDLRYSQAAERAGTWLAAQFQRDGSVLVAPHDTDKARVVLPTAFGEVFYMVEALTWLERYAVTSDARTRSREALERYLWAPNGLRAHAVNGYWWKTQNLWSDSKMGGMLYILARAAVWNHDPGLDAWTRHALAWLADPKLSGQIGVTSRLLSPTGLYGMTATGFAGIGVAEMIDPLFHLRPLSPTWSKIPGPARKNR